MGATTGLKETIIVANSRNSTTDSEASFEADPASLGRVGMAGLAQQEMVVPPLPDGQILLKELGISPHSPERPIALSGEKKQTTINLVESRSRSSTPTAPLQALSERASSLVADPPPEFLDLVDVSSSQVAGLQDEPGESDADGLLWQPPRIGGATIAIRPSTTQKASYEQLDLAVSSQAVRSQTESAENHIAADKPSRKTRLKWSPLPDASRNQTATKESDLSGNDIFAGLTELIQRASNSNPSIRRVDVQLPEDDLIKGFEDDFKE